MVNMLVEAMRYEMEVILWRHYTAEMMKGKSLESDFCIHHCMYLEFRTKVKE